MGRTEQGIENSAGRYSAIPRVLALITFEGVAGSGREVLLLKGAPDKKIWPNLYNGVGGHVEAGEDVFGAARREIREETGLTVTDLRMRGIVHIDAGAARGILMFVFTARSETRTVVASGEGALEWWPADRLPEARTMVADLPLLLAKALGRPADAPPFSARYWYDEADRLRMEFDG
ncbi:8-oxo-dGTP diphosphatase [Hydrogenispora ethanolica]|uniref:8-oxo-dGTP diphosphatase n=1 Tax=Hydrogenispora ethanolica TaxID=1082276 RepID=A0A4V2QD20_HYDET|nr:NUDIX domain-containing protein [Hydrogenispora ethanolica]TCL62737.1 8-oxo-dGTP diphosphatase [Hydrogenispora ethanolica]